MGRPRYESDDRWNEERRKTKPHVRLHHSMTNHPKTVAVWQDNNLLAQFVRVLMAASEKGAAHTDDRLLLAYNELPAAMGVTRVGPGRDRLVTLCCHLGWQVVDNPQARTMQVTLRNFALKQGLTPRGPRSEPRTPPSSPLRTPHSAHHATLPPPVLSEKTKEPTAVVDAAESGPDPLALVSPMNGSEEPRYTGTDLAQWWNDLIAPSGLFAKVTLPLGRDRRRKADLRVREQRDPVAFFESVFQRLVNTPFLRGENARSWRVSFDWLIANESNAAKILEGKYV